MPNANSARTRGSRSPAMSASSIARPDLPKMSVATVESCARVAGRRAVVVESTSANAMIALVVEATSHTLVTRRPFTEG